MKLQECELLDAMAQDLLVTQANLSASLGIAVDSVNDVSSAWSSEDT